MDAEVYGHDTCFMLKTLLLAMLCMAYVRSIHILSSQAVIKNLLQKLTFHEVRRISHLNRRETSSMKCSSLRIQTLQNWLNLADQNTPDPEKHRETTNDPLESPMNHWRVQWSKGVDLRLPNAWVGMTGPPNFPPPRRWHEWWTIGGWNGKFFWGNHGSVIYESYKGVVFCFKRYRHRYT